MAGWFKRLRGAPPPIDEAAWRQAAAGLPWLRGLQPSRLERLQALTGRFLHEKTITPLQDLRLNGIARLRLAALCCLPALEYGWEGLRGWSQLLVYPGAFRATRSHVDAAGVLHEWQDELIGEAWEQGPVILSWADVRADIAAPREGYCVAAHEIAHKLDALDGALDGTPLLPRDWQRQWAIDFQRAYDALCEQVDRGREVAIDPYAAESPEEFFAVASEYHFSDPATLQGAMPEVAAHLRRFYGEPPFA